MKNATTQVFILFTALFLFSSQAWAGIEDADRKCKSKSPEQQMSGCSELINHYLHRYSRHDQALIYAIRADAKRHLDMSYRGTKSLIKDYEISCSLGLGSSCCNAAGEHYFAATDIIFMEDERSYEKDIAATKRLEKKANRLGYDCHIISPN